MVFVDNEIAKCYGLQLFYTPTGLNFLYDALTIKNSLSGLFLENEVLSSSLLPANALSDIEKKFIREHGCNVKKENNLIIYSYQAGYARSLCTEEELEIFLDHLYFMKSILDQRFTSVLETFNDKKINLGYFDLEKKTFLLIDSSELNFESFPKLHPIYKQFSEQYKGFTPVDDEGYLLAINLPIIIEQNEETPLLLIFIYPNSNILYFDYLLSNSKNAKRSIYIPLDNAFSKIGVPLELTINNRFLYSNICKTMNSIGIDFKFSNDIPKFNNSNKFSNVLKYLDSTIEIVTKGEYLFSKKNANLIIFEICKQLNDNKNKYLFDSNDDYEYNEDIEIDTDDSNKVS